MKEYFPELGRLHDLREHLRSLFEDRRIRQPETSVVHLRTWIEQAEQTGQQAMQKFCRTLKN